MRYRLMATYQGVPYEAAIGPAGAEVVLFAACPPPEQLGFEPAPGCWRKRVLRTELGALWESRPVGSFRGEPCLVLDDLGDRLHIAYLGTDPGRAAMVGYWQVDRGVFELLAAREDVTGLAEERVERPLRWQGPPPPPASPYGTPPWPAPARPPGPAGGPPPLTSPGTAPAGCRPPSADLLIPGNGNAASQRPPGQLNGASRPATDALPDGGEFRPGPLPPPAAGPLPPAPYPPAAASPPPAASPSAAPYPSAAASPPVAAYPPQTWEAGPALGTVPPPGRAPGWHEPGDDPLAGAGLEPRQRRGRSAWRHRVSSRAVFCELADLAAIPRHAYALEEEADGALCLLPAGNGYEVFLAANGARHEVRSFADEEAAYFYLFGVLAAEAIRNGALAPR